MSLSEIVYETLISEQKSGMKQTEIAAKHNVEQSHIQPILSGQRKTGKMRLETFDKMFPNASIHLYGDSVSIHANQNSGSVVGVNRGNIVADCLSSVMDKILSTDELTDEEKVKVLRVLKKG